MNELVEKYTALIETKHKELEEKYTAQEMKHKREMAAQETKHKKVSAALKKFRQISLESLLSTVKEDDLKLVCGGEDKSHVWGHGEATPNFAKIDLPAFHPQKVKDCCLVSRVLQEFVDTEKTTDDKLAFQEVTYNSEADIVSLVLAAAKDAIDLLKHFQGGGFNMTRISTTMERSFLSCRPDILVVSFNTVPVLNIEIKKPISSGNGSLADNGVVLGQLFDQAQVVQAHSQKDVPCVLSTFSETVVCWPSESDSTKDRLNRCSPSPTASSVSTTDQQDSPSSISRGNKPDLTQSPPIFKSPPIVARTVSSEGSPEADEKPRFTPSPGDRCLAVSQTVKAHELVKALYAAICVAYDVTAPHDRKSEIYKLEPGKTYNFAKALRVEDGGQYMWGKLSNVKLGEEIVDQRGVKASSRSNRGQKDTNHAAARGPYYIIGRLGFGSTSNVFHALDCNGKEVALKVYVKNEDRASRRALTKEEFEEEAKEATKRERDRLLGLYESLENRVHVVSLFEGLHCVVMPIFTPVEKTERRLILKDIEAVLERFKEKGLKYLEPDIRWRHVGQLVVVQDDGSKKKECILYDLADLETDIPEDQDFIPDHISSLERRIEEEKQQDGSLFANSEVVDKLQVSK